MTTALRFFLLVALHPLSTPCFSAELHLPKETLRIDDTCISGVNEQVDGKIFTHYLFWIDTESCKLPNNPIKLEQLLPTSDIRYFLDMSEMLLRTARNMLHVDWRSFASLDSILTEVNVAISPSSGRFVYLLSYKSSECKGLSVYVERRRSELKVTDVYVIQC